MLSAGVMGTILLYRRVGVNRSPCCGSCRDHGPSFL